MRILVTGAHGMLGSDLMRALPSPGAVGLSARDLDITDRIAVERLFKKEKPEYIIHAAACTDVDGCERDPDTAYRVNGLGVRNVALQAEKIGATMLYVSTDYVFDGEKNEPYIEFDAPNPISVYGRSKLAGEAFVRQFCRRHCIVRTSWLFGRNGKNFVRTILRLAAKSDELRVVSDQMGSPTYSAHLARKIGDLVGSGVSGTFHVTNSGHCSWFELADAAVRQRQSPVRLVPIRAEEYAAPARRPRNSVLRNYMLQLEGMTLLPPWQDGLAEYLAENHE